MAREYTVESALAELRKLFPHHQVSVDMSYPEYSKKRWYYIQVGVNGQDFHAPTLRNCMAQVKKWRESL
jgi:hypothetical protein